jgi:hypothetical protein
VGNWARVAKNWVLTRGSKVQAASPGAETSSGGLRQAQPSKPVALDICRHAREALFGAIRVELGRQHVPQAIQVGVWSIFRPASYEFSEQSLAENMDLTPFALDFAVLLEPAAV